MSMLSRILVYPIKSLDGHELSSCTVLPSGALAEDRRYALVDDVGKFVCGKNCPAIHQIRAAFSNDLQHVTLSGLGRQEARFSLALDQKPLAKWCSERLGVNCRLVENARSGHPDDSKSPGPTIVSVASLQVVAKWFPGLDVAEVRRRFRFNLEVSGTPAFWEDGLVGATNQPRRFCLGDLVCHGCGVCQRCVVPTRDSFNGAVTHGFSRKFARLRAEALPDWSPTDRFDHFYRLGVNTRLDSCENGNVVRVGDLVRIVD